MKRHLHNNDDGGILVADTIINGKKFKVISSFDEYYSQYGSDHLDEDGITKVMEGDDEIVVKKICTLPFPVKYVNDDGEIYREVYPDLFKVISRPRKVKVNTELIENICKYCEDNAVFDKLGSYNDFYYKLKKFLK